MHEDIQVGEIFELEGIEGTFMCFDISDSFIYVAPYFEESELLDLNNVMVYSSVTTPPIDSILMNMGGIN